MKITTQQVKEDIYNYATNKATRDELLEKSKMNTKLSQTYSDMPRAKGVVTDSVSSEVFRRLVLEVRIKQLNDKLNYIDEALHILNDSQKEVIEYIINGYRMTHIASIQKRSRGQVTYDRDKAIHKITLYVNQKDKSCPNHHFG